MLRANLDVRQPIFALSSGSLPSAIAVVRLSGSGSFEIGSKILRPLSPTPWQKVRGMWLADLVDPLNGTLIDQVLVLTFVNPASFSGEDCLEIQCHGSIAVVEEIQRLLTALGARPAQRGEFSYRAMLNGKMTAADLENLGDVFLARSPRDLSKIFARRDGSLVESVNQLRADLIQIQAILDTAVDFSDEYSSVVAMAKSPVNQVIQRCSEIIQRYEAFRGGSNLPRLVLAGKPNAGKSSVFNALLGRYRAIVNNVAGTTRDVIEEDVFIGGERWKLVDTAGFRSAEGQIEAEGISLGTEYLASSSAWLLVVDGTQVFSQSEKDLLARFQNIPHLIVWNKSDLNGWCAPEHFTAQEWTAASAKTGANFNELAERVGKLIQRDQELKDQPLPTATQNAQLHLVEEGMRDLAKRLELGEAPEYLGEMNRLALSQLESVIGEVDPDAVLDRVFGEFCIGK